MPRLSARHACSSLAIISRHGEDSQSCSTLRRTCVIAAVASAEEVLATAGRERIDAAVIDHKLGDHDGLWVSGELKRLPRPPRVVLCCQSPHGLLAAAVVAEADALVSTPPRARSCA
jgi:CheY-like chemotaxis protein